MAKLTMDDALKEEEERKKKLPRRPQPSYPMLLHEDWAEDHSDFARMSESEFLGYSPGDKD